MNGNELLLDTNIVLYFLNGDSTLIPIVQENILIISIITEIELLGYSKFEENERSRVIQFIDFCTVQDITREIKEKAIAIRSDFNFKLPDSVIMATALVLDIPFITGDKNFQKAGCDKLILYEK